MTNSNHGIPYSAEQIQRIHTLSADGVPGVWIAEDIGRERKRVLEIAGQVAGHEENVLEWRRVFTDIRRHPELLALHLQFRPQ